MVTLNGSPCSELSNGMDSPNICVSPPPEEKEYSLDDAEKEHNGLIQVRVTCPNLGQKCSKIFQFVLSETVWVAKQMVLIEFSVNPNLQDALNFGFYLPPHAGRAGKFLDEQRKMKEYPMDSIEAHLEFRYKRRIFRHLYTPDEKKLLKVNSKKYRKRFMEFVCAKNLDGMQKLLEKGLDPNYHDEKTGNTPLIVAAMVDDCMDLLKCLVQYGAYLDFRSMKGETALHIVAAAGKLNVMKDFKALGASPNYKDGKGLTPLYHSILSGSDLSICEHLLSNNAEIGVSDIHGCEEIHQACKLGFPKHLELLILHGAKVNSCTSSGNTPLHICALENQLKCAQLLLHYNPDCTQVNYAQQSAYDVSVLTNHVEISQLLQKLSSDDKMATQMPEEGQSTLRRQHSVPTLPSEKTASLTVNMVIPGCPPQMNESNLDADEQSGSDSDSDDEDKLSPVKQFRTFSSAGVGTKRSPAPMIKKPLGTPILCKRLYASVPGKHFVVIDDYQPKHSGELSLKKGDVLEVLYVGDNGYLEGHIDGRGGWFPSYCVQEVKPNEGSISRQKPWLGKKSSEDVNKLNLKAPTPRTVLLKRSEKGYGFQLKGANSHVPFIDFVPSPQYPALQYLGQVDNGSVAEKAGLRAGDFVLEINNENVVNATHGYSVSLISKSNKTLSMKVVNAAPECASVDTITNAQVRSENIVEVRGLAKDPASTNPQKVGPPTPPLRSFSTSLSARVDSKGCSMFSGVPVVTKAETVAVTSAVGRKPSIKGIWSGNAFRLQGSDVNIREDDISRGIARKQKFGDTTHNDENQRPKTIAIDSHFGTCNLNRERASSLGKRECRTLAKSNMTDGDRNNTDDTRKYVRSISYNNSSQLHDISAASYNQQELDNQQYATIRKHNHPSSKHLVNGSPSKEDSSIIYDFNAPPSVDSSCKSSLPASQSTLSHELRRRELIDYEFVISDDVHKKEVSSTPGGDEANDIPDGLRFPVQGTSDFPKNVPYSHPPETDGLIRLQNQRHGKIQGKTSVVYNSNSSVSSDSKDSGYDAAENDALSQGNCLKVQADVEISNLPLVNTYENLEESSTAYLDNIIANAEASINYDSISIASSAISQNDTESCVTEANSGSTSSLSSPSLGMIEFPPPPSEFLAEDECCNKDVSGIVITSSQTNDLPALSEPPPPYTPYENTASDAMLNIPVKLQGKSFIEWDCDEVCTWLEHLSLGQYKETFVNNEIQGKHLPELTKDELKELGVCKLGHRMTLDDAISRLKGNLP